MASFADIISAIQERPELWNSKHPQNKNRANKARIFSEIATRLGMDAETLKKKWKHLKDHYRKELRKAPRQVLEGQPWGTSWQYFDSMSFVRDEIMPEPILNVSQAAQCVQVVQHSDEEESVSHPTSSLNVATFQEEDSKEGDSSANPSTSGGRKRSMKTLGEAFLRLEKKKLAILEESVSENMANTKDDDYLYLMSVLPTMKQLSTIQNLRFRGKINEWLLESISHNEYYNKIYETDRK